MQQTTTSAFVGISLDGFLARPNDDIEWLTRSGDPGEFGYNELIAGIDAIVMGRRTFEKVLPFDKWYYGDKRVVVLSHGTVDLEAARAKGAIVEAMAGTPAEIVSKLAGTGARNLYVDGGLTIQQFLRAGLIDRLILSRLPVLIGQGIPLFGPLDRDVHLRHVSTRTYPQGVVQTEYQVVAP